MNVERLTNTSSTNVYLMQHASEHPDMTVAVADYQTAGRGMGTNTWESEPGKNLLFSILLHPTALPPRWQYLLSMTEAVALCDTLSAIIPHEDVTIKWPNDIYCGDRKISGTRIDLNLTSHGIRDMVIGTGININQHAFHGDAPNPVSLWQLTHREHDRDAILSDVMQRFAQLHAQLFTTDANGTPVLDETGKSHIIRMYHERLYRRTGLHRYADGEGSFLAEIVEVHPDGIIHLRRPDGTPSHYEFKQLKFII